MKKNLDLIKNFKPENRNNFIRLKMMVNSAISGIRDPETADHVSDLTDLSSMNTLRWIKVKMEASEEGQEILDLMPRIDESAIDFGNLRKFDKNTLGYKYYEYMSSNNFTPDARPIVRYVPDVELAYICQRYKETHDFYHVLLGYGRTVLDELAVKHFEALHLRLPAASLSALFGPFSLKFSENLSLYSKYLPHVSECAKNCKFLLGINFEKRLKQDLAELRRELNLSSLNEYTLKI